MKEECWLHKVHKKFRFFFQHNSANLVQLRYKASKASSFVSYVKLVKGY